MEPSWKDYAELALIVTAAAAWIAVVMFATRLAIETLWTWLMSKLDAWVGTRYPMSKLSASDVTESSSTRTGQQD